MLCQVLQVRQAKTCFRNKVTHKIIKLLVLDFRYFYLNFFTYSILLLGALGALDTTYINKGFQRVRCVSGASGTNSAKLIFS